MSNEKNSEKSKVNSEKMKALDAVLLQIEKQYGKGSIMRLGDEAGKTEIEVIPTGCLTLDLALGIGGMPRGRIIEIYGPESSGKTTVALHAIAEAQKMGGVAAFIDAEHALDPVYAKKLGVNLEDLYVSQPDTGETGSRYHRRAGQKFRGGYHRHRLGGGVDSEGGNRRRYGR